MAVTDDFFRYVLEQLSGLRAIAPQRMRGGQPANFADAF